MKFSLALVGLLATGVLAIPSPAERRAARVARRQTRTSKPINRLEAHQGEKADVSYSSNWSGAVLSKSSGTWKSVTGTFTVPKATGGSSASSSAWVGIDGDTCGNAILQTGLDFNGDGTYDAWYEWYPDYAYDFSGITFSAGDSVTVTVTAATTKSGTAVITNNTKGKTVTKSITSSSALCEEDAEWIVEDFEENGGLVPLANFGTVAFTNAIATTNAGATYNPSSSGVEIIDIEQSNKVLTSVTTGTNSVTVKYV